MLRRVLPRHGVSGSSSEAPPCHTEASATALSQVELSLDQLLFPTCLDHGQRQRLLGHASACLDVLEAEAEAIRSALGLQRLPNVTSMPGPVLPMDRSSWERH